MSADPCGQALAQARIRHAVGGMTEVDMVGPFSRYFSVPLWFVVFIDDEGYDELTPHDSGTAVDSSSPFSIKESLVELISVGGNQGKEIVAGVDTWVVLENNNRHFTPLSA